MARSFSDVEYNYKHICEKIAAAAQSVGKTADDIATLASEGVAGCTIYAGGYKQAVEASVNAAK